MIFAHKHTGEMITVQAKTLKTARRRRMKIAIVKAANHLRLNNLITLTLNPARLPSDVCPLCFLRIVWDRFTKRLSRRVEDISFISVMEISPDGQPHIHALLSKRTAISWIREAWNQCGGGYIAEIKVLPEGLAGVAAAYITKQLVHSPIQGRLVSTSRDIKLVEYMPAHDDESPWELVEEELLETEMEIDPTFQEPTCPHGFSLARLLAFTGKAFPNSPIGEDNWITFSATKAQVETTRAG